jgi:hypothetical protein
MRRISVAISVVLNLITIVRLADNLNGVLGSVRALKSGILALAHENLLREPSGAAAHDYICRLNPLGSVAHARMCVAMGEERVGEGSRCRLPLRSKSGRLSERVIKQRLAILGKLVKG